MKKLIKKIITYMNIPFIFRIKIGKGTTIGKGLVVNGKKHQKIKIGENVSIGRYARIGNCNREIQIGDRTSIEQFSTIIGNVIIGENNLIASYVSFIGGNHNLNPEKDNGYKYPVEDISRGVIIGDNNWIGEKVIILSGVKIGNYCIIGAGSVVTKDVPDYCMIVGNPARIIKRYSLEKHSWIKEKQEDNSND